MADTLESPALSVEGLTKSQKWETYYRAQALFARGRQAEIATADLPVCMEMAMLSGHHRLAHHYLRIAEARDTQNVELKEVAA